MGGLRFEWDQRKAAVNRRKHVVSFEEARTVFLDENALLRPDDHHCDDEDRFRPPRPQRSDNFEMHGEPASSFCQTGVSHQFSWLAEALECSDLGYDGYGRQVVGQRALPCVATPPKRADPASLAAMPDVRPRVRVMASANRAGSPITTTERRARVNAV